MEAILKQEIGSETVNWTADDDYIAGAVVELPDGRAAVVTADCSDGDLVGVWVKGLFTVLKNITMTMLKGSQVYWDHSANKCNLLHGGDKDFSLGTTQETAAYAATTVLVDLNAKPAYTLSLASGYQSIPVSTAGWPHVYGGGNSFGAKFDLTAEAQKLDALSIQRMVTGAPCIVDALICINVAPDDAAVDINVGLADDTHASDADTITSSLFVHLDGNTANINMESDNAAAEVAATDTTLDWSAGTPFLVQWDLSDWSDIKVYVNGLRVCDGTTGTSRTFTLAGVAGPLKLLAHMEKSSNDSPGNMTVMNLGARVFQA